MGVLGRQRVGILEKQRPKGFDSTRESGANAMLNGGGSFFAKVWLGLVFCKGVARSFLVFERSNCCKLQHLLVLERVKCHKLQHLPVLERLKMLQITAFAGLGTF